MLSGLFLRLRLEVFGLANRKFGKEMSSLGSDSRFVPLQKEVYPKMSLYGSDSRFVAKQLEVSSLNYSE